MSTIKDVASEAGVSTATVSRVLSGRDRVSGEISRRVLEAVNKLDYRPNRVARSLRARKSNIIGLIVADIQNPYFTEVGRSVQDRAYESGYNVFLCNTDEVPGKEDEYLQFMKDENVAGVIIAPTHGNRESGRNLKSLGIPLVLLDREIRSAELDTVLIDNKGASFAMTEHLILGGRKKIAIIAGSGGGTGKERIRGYLDAHEAAGLEPDRSLVIETKAAERKGYEAVSSILDRGQAMDALISSNGLLAAGIYRRLRESSLSIPVDLAFCSFDDTLWASLVTPALTVVRQPTREIGRQAVDLLLSRIGEGRGEPVRKIVLGTELVIRQSTAGA